jgi:hypothetical protein
VNGHRGAGSRAGKTLGASKNSVAKNETQASGFQLLLRSKT